MRTTKRFSSNHLWAAAALAVVALWATRSQGRDEPTGRRGPPVVVTDAVRDSGAAMATRFSAVSRPMSRASLAFTAGGRLVARDVVVGQSVEAGTVVARIDDAPFRIARRSLRAGLTQVRTELAQAERNAARAEALRRRGATGEEEREQTAAAARALTARADQIEAQLAEAERMLRESRLVAPFDGVVTDVHLHRGEFASPGRPVIGLVGARAEAELRLPESWRTTVEVGQQLAIHTPLSKGEAGHATVRSVGQVADGGGKLFAVLLTMPEGMIPGVTLEVEVPRAPAARLAVPSSAVVSPTGERPHVFLVRDGKVARTPVTISRLVADHVEVTGAFSVGDRVVVAGHYALLDGDAVTVRRSDVAREVRR